jgi:TonB family protein
MIAAWMATALAIGLLVTAAAFAAERFFAHIRAPRRFAWLGGLIACVVWPVALFVVAQSTLRNATPLALTSIRVQAATDAVQRAVSPALPIETILVVAWIVMSLVCAGRLAWGAGVLRARRAWCEPRRIDGTHVWISKTVGPAVVGMRPMWIVLPMWIFELDEPARALVVRHEAEHVRARDPYLLWIAALAVTLMPWNPALWIHVRRLRLAIELDCDARVLRANDDANTYGELLLRIAGRNATRAFLLAPGLWEPRTNLERRIAAMTSSPRVSRSRLALLTAVGALAVGLACSVDPPVEPSGGPRIIAGGRDVQRSVARGETHYEFQVAMPAKHQPGEGVPVYPAALKSAGVSGRVIASFVVDTAGLVDVTTFKVIQSTDEEFTAAVKDALPKMRFDPARVSGGRAVKQLVQMPFEFSVK